MENIKIIREAIDRNKLVVFVGAGVSVNSELPSWSGLIKKLALSMGIDSNKEFNSEDYLRIAQYYYNQRGMKEYYDAILKEFDVSLSPNIIHEYILRMLPHHIVTTNYDNLLEQAVENNILFYDTVCQDSDLPYTPNGRLLIKMHGDLKLKNIVLKEDDYLMYSNNFRLIETFVKSLFANYTVLFIGYSLQDYDLKLIIRGVKEMLGEHFQKAYLLDSNEKGKSNVEVNYFRNLGVNIISKEDIPYEYQCIEVPKLKFEQGKNVVRIIRSILEYENNFTNIIEYYYEKLKVFKDLRKIRLTDLTNTLGINSSCLKGHNNVQVYNVGKEDKFYLLLSSLNEFANLQRSDKKGTISYIDDKYNYINKVLLRAGIQNIEVVNNQGSSIDIEIKYKVDIKVSESKLPVISCLENSSFIEIELLAKQSFKTIGMHESKYFNELIRAYANYLVNRFVTAYKILGKVSKEAYKDKEYIAFYISEYNRRYLIKKIKRITTSSKFSFIPLDIGETLYVDEINELVKEYDSSNFSLKDIYFLMPKKERDSIEFLNDLVFDDGFIYSRVASINKLREKVEKEVITRFSGIDPFEGGISEIKNEVYTFWKYTHYNLIMLDGYTEIRDYYYNFVLSLFSTYSKEKEKVEEDNTFIPLKHTEMMPNYKFNLLDLHIINSYIKNDKLKEIITQYNIDEIEIDMPSFNIRRIIFNLCSSYTIVEYRCTIKEIIENILVFSSKVRLDADDLNDIVDSITKMLSSVPIYDEIYSAILYFIIYQNKFGSITNDHILKLIISFLKKLANVEFNRQNGGFEIEAITQHNFIDILSRFAKNDKSNIENVVLVNVINSIEGGELRNYKLTIIQRVLIPLSNLVNIDFYDRFRKIVNDQLNLNFSIQLYEDACRIGMIEANEHIEEILWTKIESELESRIIRENRGESIFPDPLERILGQVANMTYSNRILNKERLKKYIGYYDIYDLIVSMDEFDYNGKFKINWLDRFDEEFIKKICSINSAKLVIKEKLEQEIIQSNELDTKIKEIYFKWFK